MSLVLQDRFGPVIAAWSWEAPAEGRPVKLADGIAARAWLSRIGAQPGEMARLRRLVGERLPVPGFGLDDGEVLERLARWVAAGELRLWEVRREGLTSWGDGPDEAQPEAPLGKQAVAELSWITIELVGEDGKPIPGERYRISLPDGSLREGRLDDKGLARVRGIEPGSCEVTFPDLGSGRLEADRDDGRAVSGARAHPSQP
ncbi:MAG: hypothetical protein QM820_13460 [Minicystis sp.]